MFAASFGPSPAPSRRGAAASLAACRHHSPAGRPGRPIRWPRCWISPAWPTPSPPPGRRSTDCSSHRVLRRQSAAVSSESALRGARASAALEGSEVPLAELRAGEVHDPLALGALRVSAGLGGLVPVWERAPLQAIARLHVLAAAGTVPDEQPRPPGRRHRHKPAHWLLPGSSPTTGPRPGSSSPRWFTASWRPWPRSAAWTAWSLARAARLTMITRGVDPKAVSVPEVGHLERAGRLPGGPRRVLHRRGERRSPLAAALRDRGATRCPRRLGDLRGGPAGLSLGRQATRERRPVDEAPPRTDGPSYQACTPSRRPPTVVGPVVPPAAGRAWVPGVRARKSNSPREFPVGESGSVCSFVRPISERRKTGGRAMSRLPVDVRSGRATVRSPSGGRRTRPARRPQPRRQRPCPPSAGAVAAGWQAWRASTPVG